MFKRIAMHIIHMRHMGKRVARPPRIFRLICAHCFALTVEDDHGERRNEVGVLDPAELVGRPTGLRTYSRSILYFDTDGANQPKLRLTAAATIGFAHSGVFDKSAGPMIFPRSISNTNLKAGAFPVLGSASALLSYSRKWVSRGSK